MTEKTARDVRDIKRKIQVSPDPEYGVHVFAVVVSKDRFSNEPMRIPATSGDPICNEIHDIVRDCYYCHGVAYLDLGEIPIGYRITMEDGLGWEEDVPLPHSVIKRHMTRNKKRELEQWWQRHDPETHELKFLQVKCVY